MTCHMLNPWFSYLIEQNDHLVCELQSKRKYDVKYESFRDFDIEAYIQHIENRDQGFENKGRFWVCDYESWFLIIMMLLM